MVIGRVIINPDDYSLEVIGVCRGKRAFSFLETRTKIPNFLENLLEVLQCFVHFTAELPVIFHS